MMSQFDCDYIKNIATDGITTAFSEIINELTEEEFSVWLDYHFKTCERRDIQGYSNHMLYIGKKK